MRTSAAVHSSMQSPRSFVRHPSRPHPWGIRSLQPLNDRSESLLELGRRFLDLEQSIIHRLGYRAKSRFVRLGYSTSLFETQLDTTKVSFKFARSNL